MGNDVKCSKGDKYNTIYTSISAQAKNKIGQFRYIPKVSFLNKIEVNTV